MEKNTLAELRDMCRTRGLRVSGSKRELIDRLASSEAAAVSPVALEKITGAEEPPTKRARTSKSSGLTPRTIAQKLRALGIWDFSRCAASAVCSGYLRWNGTEEELDQPAVLADGSLLEVSDESYLGCKHKWNPTLRSLLEQPDYGGDDYESELENSTVRCPKRGCKGRLYVTDMCFGEFRPDSGKFHNHCRKCPNLGVCLDEYRESHCPKCGHHAFMFRCYTCHPRKRDSPYDD